MIIGIINKCSGITANYAQKELKRFLSEFTNDEITDNCTESCNAEAVDRYFILELLSGQDIESHSYKISGQRWDNKPAVVIAGASTSSMLTGVYEALTKMGIFFDIDKRILKRKFDVSALDNLNEVFTPFCRNRGIRQHINFPMDISAYHIEDAREYVRNLARMRMNSITFHSYTGQWHGYETADKEILAGNFFYGQRHVVPDYKPILEAVPNRRYHCIPEVENVLNDAKARSEFAIYWLNEVMYAGKEAGIKIVLSFEFPHGEEQQTLIDITRSVLQTYPLVDAIEWISPEGGGQGEPVEYACIAQKVAEMFGDEALVDGELPYMPETLPESLSGAMSNLKKAVDLYKMKEKIFEGLEEKPIYIGLYVMCKHTLKILKNIIDRVVPKEVICTFLPAHGSLAVAENIDFMDFNHHNWQNTLMYSWIEFDGNMYLQQNSCDGIQQLIEDAKVKSNAGSIHGMCLNHWRTAENSFTIVYAAHTMINPVKASNFYKYYAEVYGIHNIELMKEILEKIAAIDIFNRNNLFNIGFCYLGCWLGTNGLGWIRGWDVKNMDDAIEQYSDVKNKLNKCLETTVLHEGIVWLRFLINRVECSILQIQAIKELEKITRFADDNNPQGLTQIQKEKIASICDAAMQLSRQYIDRHMEMVLDRGCEGTAISYYATIPTYIDHIKQYFVYGETECKHNPDTFDAPPPPDSAYLI